MGPSKTPVLSAKLALPYTSANKFKRHDLRVKQKKVRDKDQREIRFRRKKEEDKDPELRVQRLAKNKPVTQDQKRTWDDVDDDGLGVRVDVERLKRRRLEEEQAVALDEPIEEDSAAEEGDDVDSMLGSDEEVDGDKVAALVEKNLAKQARRDDSLAPSTTSTHLDLTPASLALKFPQLFSDEPPPMPKILVTTSLNSTLHKESELLCGLFPNSHYIRRSAHRYSHKYSLREICKFASNREYTAVVLLKEDQKKPTGLSIVSLPSGPTVHFSISNWMEGRKIPGHGNPTNHYPELLLKYGTLRKNLCH